MADWPFPHEGKNRRGEQEYNEVAKRRRWYVEMQRHGAVPFVSQSKILLKRNDEHERRPAAPRVGVSFQCPTQLAWECHLLNVSAAICGNRLEPVNSDFPMLSFPQKQATLC